jgi:hypothetical protein
MLATFRILAICSMVGMCVISLTAQTRQPSVAPAITVSAPVLSRGAATTFTVSIALSDPSNAGVGSFQFSLLFDPAVITPQGTNFGCSNTGTLTAAAGQSPFCNVEAGIPGTLLVSDFGSTATSGSGTLFTITFKATQNGPFPRTSTLHFTDVFFYSLSQRLTTTINDGSVQVTAPTAANVSVSGRVLSSVGAGVRAARVTFTDENGLARSVVTNTFGRYSFSDLPSGRTYVATAASRGITFSPRAVVVNDTLTDVDISPE